MEVIIMKPNSTPQKQPERQNRRDNHAERTQTHAGKITRRSSGTGKIIINALLDGKPIPKPGSPQDSAPKPHFAKCQTS